MTRTAAAFVLLIGGLLMLVSCRPPQGPPAPPYTTSQPVIDPMTAVNTVLPAPDDYARVRIDTPGCMIPPYARFLQGVRICLDPGHGGDARQRGFKRGPTGVREAEVNLRVAQFLRDLLVAAGADVRLTREADRDRSLEERAAMANAWPADLFVSLHHNAISSRPQANHTTVWYHADVDYRAANLDLARYLCQGLVDALDLPEISTVPLKSDQLMYPDGFGVLRHAQVTVALTEASFFTNPEEEQRLRDPAYNLREAYGLFVALARYAAAGLPRATLIEPVDGVVAPGGIVAFELDDGLRERQSWGHERQMILTDSLVVRLDGEMVPFRFWNQGYRVEFDLPVELTPGEHLVEMHFQNMNKNSVLQPEFVIQIPPAAVESPAATVVNP